jgi:hypothetical protein
MLTLNKDEREVSLSTVSEITESTQTLGGNSVYVVNVAKIVCSNQEDAEAIKEKVDAFLVELARNLWG